jgi:uncharacterized protein YdiU (UPF0061 family)
MTIKIPLENTYADRLEGLYLTWQGAKAPSPAVALLNEPLARALGLDVAALRSPAGAAILSGGEAPEGARPLAQAYAGHQFGGYSPLLGDGRALLVGELVDPQGRRWDLHLKGSGRTPFSRGGDGKATLGPMLREAIFGEFMAAVGIPSSRALAVTTTGEQVWREGPLPGAVLARIASSHLRVGTFELFAHRGELDKLQRLLDYAIWRHDPALEGREDRALAFLGAVIARQAALVAQWVAVGFVHGVMNTDNVTISGETIDYGPCAFVDAYDPGAVFSSIDHQGRYAYGNQPRIMQWDLARLAEALLPLVPGDRAAAVDAANAALEGFDGLYQRAWRARLRQKLGLRALSAPSPFTEAADDALCDDLMGAIQGQGVDYTGLFRALAQVARGEEGAAAALARDPGPLRRWQARWLERLALDPGGLAAAAAEMDRANPVYIPRNHLVERALAEAVQGGELGGVERLVGLLRAPFEAAPGREEYARPAPAGARPHVTFCGT